MEVLVGLLVGGVVLFIGILALIWFIRDKDYDD